MLTAGAHSYLATSALIQIPPPNALPLPSGKAIQSKYQT